MVESFESFMDTSEKSFLGHKGCPGPIELRNSMFGTCVENHPDMWAPR